MNPDSEDTLYLLWPERQRPPSVDLPDGYALRAYHEDDRSALLDLLTEHWALDGDEFQEFLDRVLPLGLFLVETRESGQLAGTASVLHNPCGGSHHFPFGGEVGFVYVRETHRRQGLGRALTSAAVRRLDAAGYTSIRVGVAQNPAAVLLYLDLGFQPFAYADRLIGRWRDVYDELGLPFDRDRLVTP